jgi:hypothetical protein
MIRTKELIPRIGYVPGDKMSTPLTWKYSDAGRDLRVGDVVEFLCNGRGRGGHVCVHAKVTKVNRKTFRATELPRSYSPGTLWNVNIEHALEPGNGGITIDLAWKE